jgi:hypothetical protein
MTDEDLAAELAALRRKLEKRKDQPGFAANAAAIEARIAEIEAELAQ